MLLGTRMILPGLARGALTALLAVVCLLSPVAPLVAGQLVGRPTDDTCSMACCRRAGHCCCNKPKPAAPTSGPVLSAPGCPAGCGASVQPAPSASDLFRPAGRFEASLAVQTAPLAHREANDRTPAGQNPSLWQRPPPLAL